MMTGPKELAAYISKLATQYAQTPSNILPLTLIQHTINAHTHHIDINQTLKNKGLPPIHNIHIQQADIHINTTQEVNLQHIHKIIHIPNNISNLTFSWNSQRSNLAGLRIWEWTAKLHHGQELLLDSSDVNEIVHKDHIQPVLETLDGTNQKWMLAFLLTTPSDDAFDVISDLLEKM